MFKLSAREWAASITCFANVYLAKSDHRTIETEQVYFRKVIDARVICSFINKHKN